MAEFHEYLRGLLEKRELWVALAEAFSRHISEDWVGKSDTERIEEGRGIYTHDEKYTEDELSQELAEVFQKHVINSIGQLAPITAEDLAAIAISQLTGIPFWKADCDERNIAMRRFWAFARTEIQADREGGEKFSLGLWRVGADEPLGVTDQDFEYGITLWNSQTGLSLILELENCLLGDQAFAVSGFLYGGCSSRALPIAEAQFGPLIQSIGKTLTLSQPYTVHAQWWQGILSFLVSGDGLAVMRTSLSAYFRSNNDADDTLIERVCNATILLEEADRVNSDRIALSLSFAAIEALVCEKDELPVNRQIKRHVATLLVQDAAQRDKAEKVVSKLYTIRCDVLHGNKVHGSSAASAAVRRISAGVIRAVVCWRENQQKVGGSTTWKELMDEINAASRKPDIVVGVPDLSELVPTKVPS